MLPSGSNICDGSIPSPVFALRLRAFLVGDASAFAVVWRREDFLGQRFGAGVNSSSSGALKLSSSSDSSTMTFLRAARRVGLVGETVAMLAMFRRCSWFRDSPELDAFLLTFILIGGGALANLAPSQPCGGRATSQGFAAQSYYTVQSFSCARALPVTRGVWSRGCHFPVLASSILQFVVLGGAKSTTQALNDNALRLHISPSSLNPRNVRLAEF
jgi:hypothetical protein